MDTVFDWLPAITTTGLLSGALWLGRNLIATRLTRSVEHEFNAQLERVKAELRSSEESLKAELKLKEVEITTLRSGALSALASRQIALDKRRLEAVDQLWSTVIALAPARGITIVMKAINIEAAAQLVEQDQNTRKAFEAVGCNFDLQSIDFSGAFKAQPYLSPMVWAVYSALLAVVMHGTLRWFCLTNGFGQDFSNDEHISNLIKIALPGYSDYVNQTGSSGYYHVVDALEQRLLEEIRTMLSGVEDDKATLVRAAEILKQSQTVIKSTEVAAKPQPDTELVAAL